MAGGGGRTDEPGPDRSVLALNRGSSSIKVGLFTFGAQPRVLCRETIDASDRQTSAFPRLLERLTPQLRQYRLAAVAHRLVHGGSELHEPEVVSAELISVLEGLAHLAPNHLPDEIALVREARQAQPDVPQVVCFDTAFHRDLPEVASRLPIPDTYASRGVRRYGFHGLSYTFLMDALRERAASSRIDRVILAHLGNGSSLAAVRDGRAIDTTMGFTPIGGVVMSTRTGDLDPGVVTHIARLRGCSADRLEDELSHHSGLAALSGGTSDMRALLEREASDERSRLAVAIYCYEIKKRIGAYAAALGGLDALVFSGGIGEHASPVRSKICAGLGFLGIEMDETANAGGLPVLSSATSRVAVHVIATDEEVVMARAAYRVLHKRA